MKILLPLFIVGLCAVGTGHAATLYKWTDDEGNVHYSQTPPENRKADQMQIKDSAPSGAPSQTPAAEEEQAADESEPPADAGQDPKVVEIRKRNCETARGNLEVYKTSARIRQADGSIMALSDEMRENLIQEAEKMIEENCR
ncbi:MAG TPA: DUF4124 domain-containing protein [Gammaproteobacteria bacterium]